MMNDYTPVLGDFGMTQTISQAKASGFSGGSPKFMGEKVDKGIYSLAIEDCKADIFAMGVIFYDLIY